MTSTRKIAGGALGGVALALLTSVAIAAPTVSNVSIVQGPDGSGGTKGTITYDLLTPDRPCAVTVRLSKNSGVDNYPFAVTSVSGAVTGVTSGAGKTITWALATDYPNEEIPNARVRVIADDGCPQAKNDAVSTNEDTVLNGNLFSNNGSGPDSDTLGGTLTVSEVNGLPAAPINLITLGSGAKLTVFATGAFSYNPNGAFNSLGVGQQGNDSFTYTVTDGTGSCPSTATVSVTISGLNDAPTVTGENYQTVGNTTLEVAATQSVSGAVFLTGNLLANDSDADGPSALTASFVTQSAGASTTVNTDGSFMFTPAVGATSGSFIYSVSDGATSTAGVVNVNCVGEIWYVKNDAAAGGTGRSLDPFDTLAEAQSATSAGDTIYIELGNGNSLGQNAGITLKPNQRLIGEGVALVASGTVNGLLNPTLRAAGDRPVVSHAGAPVVSLASDNTLRGLTLSMGVGATAISGTGFGTLTADTVHIQGAWAPLSLNIGTLAASFPSVSSSFSATAISLTACMGTLDIDGGSISGSTGAAFVVNGGVSTTFSGSMSQGLNAALVSVSGGHTGTLQFDTGTLSATDGTGLQFDNADGIYNFLGTTTLSGGDAGIDVVNGSGGNFSFSDCPITNPSGAALLVSGGAGSIGHAGAISKSSAGRLVAIQGRTGGSVTVSGGLSSTGSSTGILVQNCTGGTVTFSSGTKTLNTGINQAVTLTNNTGAAIDFTGGGLDIDTTSATGFAASGGGTISVQGTGNTIASTAGTALDVSGTTIGSNHLTFLSISSGTVVTSAGVGILLANTGPTGGLHVTGDGTTTAYGNGSGGTIRNKAGSDAANTQTAPTSGVGVLLNNTTNVELSNMVFTSFDNHAIFGTGVNGIELTYSKINGTTGTSSGSGDAPIALGLVEGASPGSGTNGLTGFSLFRSVEVTGGIEHNVEVYLTNGNADLTIDNCSIHDNAPALGGDGILMETYGSSTARFRVAGSTFSNNRSRALRLNAMRQSAIDISVDNNVVSRSSQGDEGFVLSNRGDADLTAAVTNNLISGLGGAAISVGQGAGNATDNSLLQATITANIVTAPSIATNTAILALMSSTVGQISQARLLIHGNTVTQGSAMGLAGCILVDTPHASTSPTFHATVTRNQVAVLNNVTGTWGIAVQARQSSNGHFRIGRRFIGDPDGNTVTYPSGVPPGVLGVRARHAAPATASLETGSSGGLAAAVLAANNPASTTEVLGTISVVGNSDVITPVMPTLPTLP